MDKDNSIRQRDGRLTVLLVLAGGFLATVLALQYLVPSLSPETVKTCERLGISDTGLLEVRDCVEGVDSQNKSQIASHLTPFFYAPVQINSAEREMLMTAKGVGPTLADRILKYRQSHGMFHHPKDLQKLSGVGRKKAAAIALEFNFTEVR